MGPGDLGQFGVHGGGVYWGIVGFGFLGEVAHGSILLINLYNAN